ncbi:uracil-DNA glycosylase family protein [Fictibacillus sp. Mic-4]|uniref:uracil-DNA glycosylase family protein n=1 Tax=Fictibacillus TaxID=1329200 RepID=UPI0003FDEE32|nr:uracil-DNA glycosylase family protein [Fictibacillus gelatini]
MKKLSKDELERHIKGIEVENKEDYGELDFLSEGIDKDDCLDRRHPNEVTPVLSFLETKFQNHELIITVGADDPSDLDKHETVRIVHERASLEGFPELLRIDHIRLYGQNELCQRDFYFERGDKKEKENKYRELVLKRKSCSQCSGLNNPSIINNGEFDSNEIGPWTTWKGSLDAKVMVVGQDWGDEETFVKQKGEVNPGGHTNKNLVKLLQSIGLSPENNHLFFTNMVLCMKNGGLSAKLKTSWLTNCTELFLKQLIQVVEPEIIILLGARTYQAFLKSYGMKPTPFKQAVESKEPIIIEEKIKVFPVYHCGRLGEVNRKFADQLKDWEKIKKHI